MTRFNPCLKLLATSALIAFAAFAFSPAQAAGTPEPNPVNAPDGKKPDEKPDPNAQAPKPDVKPADAKPEEAKPDPNKKSDNRFLDGYKKAYALIYDPCFTFMNTQRIPLSCNWLKKNYPSWQRKNILPVIMIWGS